MTKLTVAYCNFANVPDSTGSCYVRGMLAWDCLPFCCHFRWNKPRAQ